jgi:tRNA G18 (ribose-2'-O)-methylase SpoU
MKEIISRNNPLFKQFARLAKSQGIKKYNRALISGLKQITEVIRDHPEWCTGLIIKKGGRPDLEMRLPGVSLYSLDRELFSEIDFYGTDQPILIVRVPPLPSFEDNPRPIGCTLFIPFQDPVNVGAIIRSAAAFGVSRGVILKEAAHPFHYKSARVAGSTLFKLPLVRGPSILDLKTPPLPLFTLSPTGEDLRQIRFPARFGLIPGLEGPGLPIDLKDMPSIRIPMETGVESLNAAIAAGIVLFWWRNGPRG